MKTGLIVFGILFLVIGGLIYSLPTQDFAAETTTTGEGNTNTYTSTASVDVPKEWAYASAIIGMILLVMGLAIPGKNLKESYDLVEKKENVVIRNGKKQKVVKETREKHVGRKEPYHNV